MAEGENILVHHYLKKPKKQKKSHARCHDNKHYIHVGLCSS